MATVRVQTRTVKLLLAEWAAAIPADWDFSVQFAPADKAFIVWSGRKLMALKGTLLRGKGAEVESLFTGMVKHGYAEEVAEETGYYGKRSEKLYS